MISICLDNFQLLDNPLTFQGVKAKDMPREHLLILKRTFWRQWDLGVIAICNRIAQIAIAEKVF